MEKRSSPVRLSDSFGKGKKSMQLARDISESLGKLPPQALDLEEAVLGAVLMERPALQQIVDVISANDFYSDQHKTIYEAIVSLYIKGQPIDMRMIVAELRRLGKLEISGGASYIAELTSRVSTGANIEAHAQILVEHSIKRDIIHIASQIHHSAYEDTTDAIELLEDSQTSLDQISSRHFRGKYSDMFTMTNVAVKEAEEKRNHKGLTGVATGLSRVDRTMAGWQKQDLVIVAARPGMGKTAFICAVAKNAAHDFDTPVGIFSLEMSKTQLVNRMICSECEVDISRLNKGQTSDFEMERFKAASAKLAKAPLVIDDTAALSIMEFRARARRMVSERGVKVIFLDYLQLMKGDVQGNREQEISSISRGLKRVAKELNIPVIALSQLSRSVESRGGDKRPMLSDLRESGSIEQDSDIVIFLYRAEYYKITELEDGRSSANVMELIIAKHRNGALDSIPVKFLGQHMKVVDWDSFPETNIPERNLTRLSDLTNVRDITQSGVEREEEKPNDDLPF